jgi:phenylacetate-CoA ligase
MSLPTDGHEALGLIQAALADWPDGYSTARAALMFDEAMIAHLDAQPEAGIRAFQKRRVDALLRHARANSPRWAERLQENSGWTDYPILGKEEYRAIAEAGALALSEDRAPAASNATSGSTGRPVSFHACVLSRRHGSAQALYNWRRQGLNASGVLAMITQKVPVHSGEYRQAPHSGLPEGRVYQRRARQFSVEAHARWLPGIGANYLLTVPSILRGMLDVYEAEGGAPRLDLILTYAESVEPELRTRAAALLGAQIRDSYGCEEIGPLAYQCPHSGAHYHVAVANTVIEIVDDDARPCPDGVIGRVIATGLTNYATPSIRYELGDLAASRWGCPCGFEGQVLEKLLGRARFLLKLPSGERRHPGTLASSWLAVAPVRERRLVQVSRDVVQVEIVMDRPITEAEREGIAAMLKRELTPEFRYEIIQVAAIAWGQGFKRQDIICLV